jgi:hypothetical protein
VRFTSATHHRESKYHLQINLSNGFVSEGQVKGTLLIPRFFSLLVYMLCRFTQSVEREIAWSPKELNGGGCGKVSR